MHLYIHSDASYLSEICARSRAGGYFFLSDKPKKLPPKPHNTPLPLNGAIHVHSSIMRSVLSSATEAETDPLFHNAKDAAPFRITLLKLGHPQGPTPIQTDNACALGIINDTVKQRRSKAMDMRFIRSRTASPKTNTSSIGAKAATTSLTTSPSIIPRLTIASCARGIWLTYTNQLLCKGVLNLPRNHFRVILRSRPQTSRIAQLSSPPTISHDYKDYDHLPTHLAAAFRGLSTTYP